MTPQETVIIISIINTAYPKFSIETNKDKMKLTIQLWHELLGDMPYQIVQTAVKKLVLESPYPPTIADVRKRVMEVTQPREVDGADAWGQVMNAVKHFGYYRPDEALEGMTDRTKRVVKMIGYQEICMTEQDTLGVVRGQFLKMYEQVSGRERNEALLPQSLKDQINVLTNGFDIKMLEGESA